MSTRLKFPKGSSFSFIRQFIRDGDPVDITSATLSAYLKYSPDDADVDAIATLTVAVANSTLGIVRVTIAAADTEDLARSIEYYWRCQADLGGGDIVTPEALHGPVSLTPAIQLIIADLADEELDASEASALTPAPGSFLGIRADLTSAALHKAVVTAGRTPLPWVIATLESGTFVTWTLRARTVDDDPVTYPDQFRVPDDYHATTNYVIWVRSSLT